MTGIVVCIQPVLTQSDFASEEAYYLSLKKNIQTALSNIDRKQPVIVCFPEYIGMWLILVDQPKFVFRAKSFKSALRRYIAVNFLKLVVTSIKNLTFQSIFSIIFRSKSKKVLSVYTNVMSKLAIEFNITLVGGSTILPELKIKGGIAQFQNSHPLFNVSLVWNAQGDIIHSTTKVYPTEPEKKYLKGGKLSELTPCQTPIGNLGIIICADGWHQNIYSQLAKQHVDLFVTLAYVPSDVDWLGPWKGYSGTPCEPDINTNDIKTLSERDAWKTYCASRCLPYSTAKGVVFFMQTHLWDYGSHGAPLVIQNGKVTELPTDTSGYSVAAIELSGRFGNQ